MWGREIDDIDRVLYQRWVAIRSRCQNPLNPQYKNYGGRGITLSGEFQDYATFVDYIRQLPNFDLNNSLDRINNDKGYERNNIKFSTQLEQSNNQQRTIFLTFNGRRMSAKDFAREYVKKYKPQQVARLAREGLTGEQILEKELTSRRAGLRYNKLRAAEPVCDRGADSP